MSAAQKFDHVRHLVSYFGPRTYPEVRMYRALKWDDIDPQCAKTLKEREFDIDDALGPNAR